MNVDTALRDDGTRAGPIQMMNSAIAAYWHAAAAQT
jgi:hypothetical protein